jgi:hypothetical protein
MSNPLEHLTIASPCHADWQQMQGTDQVRFCGDCKLNVYNLSGMTRAEAEALIKTTEGRLCVRYFQRSDGTIITQDCPVGLQTLHRRKVKRFGKIAAAVTLVTVLGAFCVSQAKDTKTQSPEPEHNFVMGKVRANPAVMGDVALPPQAYQGGIKPSVAPTPNPPKPKKSKKTKQPDSAQIQPVSNPDHPVMGNMVMPLKNTIPSD